MGNVSNLAERLCPRICDQSIACKRSVSTKARANPGSIYLLDIEDRSRWVRGILVLCCVTHQAFLVGERNIRRRDSVSLVIDDDLNLSLLHHSCT